MNFFDLNHGEGLMLRCHFQIRKNDLTFTIAAMPLKFDLLLAFEIASQLHHITEIVSVFACKRTAAIGLLAQFILEFEHAVGRGQHHGAERGGTLVRVVLILHRRQTFEC